MKKGITIIFLSFIALLCVTGCSSNKPFSEFVPSEKEIPSSTEISSGSEGKSETDAPVRPGKSNTTESIGLPEENQKMIITAGSYNFTVTLEKNSSAEALKQYLANEPVTLSLDDYAGMEKVGDLGTTLPRNDTQITTISGDVILYLGDQFSIYYGKNSWNFTMLGHIDDVEHLEEALGKGSIEVTLSLN
ncbi:cyclophilin-like fold protein [Acidaminobacter sp.]|uniref:cyclophilin-like fold protein n=1 Tax=Acidaminobacter sp. TaxID=1872102 RepID=UPI0025B8DDC4|nr:cyclophilin-like fold protein [Acidaminobacter sp.]